MASDQDALEEVDDSALDLASAAYAYVGKRGTHGDANKDRKFIIHNSVIGVSGQPESCQVRLLDCALVNTEKG